MPTHLPEDFTFPLLNCVLAIRSSCTTRCCFIDATGRAPQLELGRKRKRSSPRSERRRHPSKTNRRFGKGRDSPPNGHRLPSPRRPRRLVPGITPDFLPEGVGFSSQECRCLDADPLPSQRPRRRRTARRSVCTSPRSHRAALRSRQSSLAVKESILRAFFSIPAGDDNFKLDGDAWATSDFTLLSAFRRTCISRAKVLALTMTPARRRGVEPSDDQ